MTKVTLWLKVLLGMIYFDKFHSRANLYFYFRRLLPVRWMCKFTSVVLQNVVKSVTVI